jgi:1,2-diacylglycerol 3-alpha-glucosyltransferase
VLFGFPLLGTLSHFTPGRNEALPLPKTMKVLIASDTYPPDVNGAAYFSYRLGTALAKRGHEVSVICPSRGVRTQTSVQRGVRVLGVHSLPLLLYPEFRFAPPFLVKRSIRNFLSVSRPDVVHIQNHFLLSNAVFEVAREFGIPVMGTNHMVPENLAHHLHLPPNAEKKVRIYLWSRFAQIYKQLCFVTAPTETAAKYSQRPGLGKEVIPISCGIDLRHFSPDIDGSQLTQRYGIPSRLVLLYVGRLDKEKRIEVILRAMPSIVERVDAQLVVAGPGKLRTDLESLVIDLRMKDRVTFLGRLPEEDIPRLYRAADVFVIGGIAELQSIVTMEAMASGLPVIAANAMALPELVHHGENGFLFPVDDAQALAEAAVAILSNEPLRRRMAKKSLEMIKVHDINKVVEQYEMLYVLMLGGHARTH